MISGADCLPLAVDQLLIDVYFYLDKSSKRQENLKQQQVLLDIETSKILKHGTTRWLSLGLCLPRLMNNWRALYKFFLKEETSADGSLAREKARKLRAIFQSPSKELYCLFLKEAIKVFEKVNKALQKDAPQLHRMNRMLRTELLKELFACFVRPSAIADDVVTTPFQNPKNWLPNQEIVLGDDAMNKLADEKSGLSDERKKEFFQNVKAFYVASCDYIINSLPLKKEVLIKAKVADPSAFDTVNFSDLDFFLKKWPVLIPPGTQKSEIQKEFNKYRALKPAPSTYLPDPEDEETEPEPLDHIWAKLGQVKEEGKVVLKHLPRVMASLLTIPHSSAHCERVFSMVRKNQTDFRASMKTDTLQALLVAKSRPGSAVDRVYSKDQLQSMKGAYYRSLQATQQLE